MPSVFRRIRGMFGPVGGPALALPTAAALAQPEGPRFAMPDPPGPFCPLSAEQLDAVVSCGANQPAVGTHHDGFGALSLEYDSIDPRSSVREGAFRRLDPAVACEDSGTWKTARWTIRGGRFADRRNGRDFRPAVTQGELAVRRITASQIESSQKQRRHCRPGRVPAN